MIKRSSLQNCICEILGGNRMFIRKVKIHNFKCYRDFEITLEEGLNIVVGDNEAGKSTILEAINLALTGIISGKSIWNEISQYIFNKEAVDEYITSLNTAPIELPYIANTIFIIKKDGKEIFLLARPSDGGEVRIYYETEKDLLDYTMDWELWVEDGKSEPQKITFGKMIKLTGLNRIPLRGI